MNKIKDNYGFVCNNTFWNRKRNSWYNYHKQEAGDKEPYGWSYKELSEDLGYTVGAIQSWFSGRVMPGERAGEVICDFFEVDVELGMGMFAMDHDAYLKAHTNPNQVTIEDVLNDSVPENFNLWPRRNKIVHIFNSLSANDSIKMSHIGKLILLIDQEMSTKYTITSALGELFSRSLNVSEYNEFYEILRPYILAEKGTTNEQNERSD